MLRVEGLAASYGAARVLFGLSFHLSKGEVVALMGRNGAGKTTCLKAIMGLVQEEAGTIHFDGQAIDQLQPFEISRLGLGFVPEERRIFTDLTVRENLEVGRRPAITGHDEWTIERLVSLFSNLRDKLGRRAAAMSGGEQQMLAISRTLMGNPKAILLDEPSEGLAPVIVDDMAAAILAMKAAGLSILLSEQNFPFASLIADRVLMIERGEIRFDGPMAEVKADRSLRERYLGL